MLLYLQQCQIYGQERKVYRRAVVPLIHRIKPYTLVKLAVTVTIGVSVGVLAVGLAVCTEAVIKWKNEHTRHIIHDGHSFGVLRAALFHCAFSVALVLLGSSYVRPHI